jgi:putative transposase
MPREAATEMSLAEAHEVIKDMDLMGLEWRQEYQESARQAAKMVLEAQMVQDRDQYLEEVARRGGVDRRNGFYTRHLLTKLGDIELAVPRTRHYSAVKVVKNYARRTQDVDGSILACFVLGISTRKVAEALLSILSERVSASTVSRVAKQLDEVVEAFHRRRLKDAYRALILDGVVMKRKTGAGAVRRPVLVALGLRPDGKKEVIDFRQAPGESREAWEAFLNDLYQRGLVGQALELVVVDGGSGLLASLSLTYPHLPVQRCWAHKIRNILDKAKKKDQNEMKTHLHHIMNAPNRTQARHAARQFTDRWEDVYPKAVACLRDDLDELLTFFIYQDEVWRKAVRTTNAIERRFVEVRRRTRPMGVFSDKTSVDRILFAVFSYENKQQGIATPFLVTHNS